MPADERLRSIAQRDELIAKWQRLVHWQVRRMCKTSKLIQSLDYDDAAAAGNEGLLKAAERYDPTKGCKFNTYAVFWIRQAVQKAAAGNFLVHVPANYIAGYRRPDLTKSADCLYKAQKAMDKVMSIILRPKGEDNEAEIEELARECPPEQVMENHQMIEVEAILGKMRKSDQRLMRWRYLEGLTLEQIGKRMHITREAVRQQMTRTLKRARWAATLLEEERRRRRA